MSEVRVRKIAARGIAIGKEDYPPVGRRDEASDKAKMLLDLGGIVLRIRSAADEQGMQEHWGGRARFRTRPQDAERQ